MTRIDRSPEILDAMAANRREGHQRIATAALHRHSLIQWQASYHAEPSLRLTGRHPALIVDGDNEAIIEASQVGVDFTADLIEWVDASFPTGPGRDDVGAHGRNPTHDALIHWDRECRRRHAQWPDHRGRPICAEIAWAVIGHRYSLQTAAEVTEVSYPRAERLLKAAVEFMRKRQDRWLSSSDVSATHDKDTCRICSPLPKTA